MVAESNFAELQVSHRYRRIKQLRRRCGRSRHHNLAGRERLAFFRTPYIFCKLGEVDKRIAIALNGKHLFVAVNFFLAYRVGPMPLQQKLHGPGRERRIQILANHIGIFPREVLIAGYHIEIRTGKIALILVVRLKHFLSAATLTVDGRPDKSHTIVERSHGNLAERKITLGLIGTSLRRIEVVKVDISAYRGTATPPTLGERMLAVETAERIKRQRDIGIHIPPKVGVGARIRTTEIIGERTVRRYQGKVTNQFTGSSL